MRTGKIGGGLLTALLVLGLMQPTAPAAPARSPERPFVSAALLDKGLDADGTIVRRTPDATVTRVNVPHGGSVVTLYRVRVAGDFPPRALRYEVRAGREGIGYGIPIASGDAVETVTGDVRVLERRLSAAYPRAAQGVAGSSSRGASGDQATVPDPAVAGPHAVSRTRYDLGDEVFQPSGIRAKVEVAASVRHPTDLENGPYPLVLLMHGNHASCFRKDRARFQWPCKEGWKPLPNHRGYDYLAEPLASHGYVVVSISANGVNVKGNRVRDTGMRQRGELVDKHLRLWQRWSTSATGPFAGRFSGAIDMTRIGTMGHSRGGEGVVWHKVVDDERETPFGVDAVLALAPVDFTRQTINDVPFATVLPTCDGDVSDLQGVHFFDDSRYNLPGDLAPKHTVTMFGANHNHFNRVWSPSSRFPDAMDDADNSGCFGDRLSEKRQRRLGASYMIGFFRRYLIDELAFDPMWTGAATPAFTGVDEVRVGYHAPDTPTHRRDVVRFTRAADLRRSHLGDAIFTALLSRYGWCANTIRTPCLDGQQSDWDIHHPGLAQAIVGWEVRGGGIGMRLPEASRDVSDFDAFQFRAVVPPGYELNTGKFQDLSVLIIDMDGRRSKVAISELGENLAVPGRYVFGQVMMEQIRVPMSSFDGIDLSNVRAVKLRFDRKRHGVVHVSDIAFSRGGAVVPKVP